MGFALEDFGGNTLLVREVPTELAQQDIAQLLGDIAAKLLNGNRDLTPHVLDRLCFSIACKGAMRARDKNALPELQAIVHALESSPEIAHCPHGRPVEVCLPKQQIEKMFGRQG